MGAGDEYRNRAAESLARAHAERDHLFRSIFEELSKTYLRMADVADETHHDSVLSPPTAPDHPTTW